jgi:hypothetical protein
MVFFNTAIKKIGKRKNISSRIKEKIDRMRDKLYFIKEIHTNLHQEMSSVKQSL